MAAPYTGDVQRYAITSRGRYGSSEAYRLESVVQEASCWAAEGVNFLQIREKDLEAGELVQLVRQILTAVRSVQTDDTMVLVNGRADVALAAGADGVHLTAAPGELTPQQVREIYYAAASNKAPFISMSCHSTDQVRHAAAMGADAILFGPVFGKVIHEVEVTAAVGLEQLKAACREAAGVPVFALGGVTRQNTEACLQAGAAGVAGIRLFQRHPHE